VIGSRGCSGFADTLLGSVAQRCIHHATCPVVVIRGSHRSRTLARQALRQAARQLDRSSASTAPVSSGRLALTNPDSEHDKPLRHQEQPASRRIAIGHPS
jgi:hypothetical protein